MCSRVEPDAINAEDLREISSISRRIPRRSERKGETPADRKDDDVRPDSCEEEEEEMRRSASQVVSTFSTIFTCVRTVERLSNSEFYSGDGAEGSGRYHRGLLRLLAYTQVDG